MAIEIEVEILPEDIEGAKQGVTLDCPVARAMQRTTGDTSIRAFSAHLAHYVPSKNWPCVGGRVSLPKEIRRLIKKFDETGEFPPTRFTISLPASWVKKT